MERNILITGGTKGIGAAIAKRIVQTQPIGQMMLNYAHDDEAAEAFAASLAPQAGGKIVLAKADLSCEEGLEALVNAARQLEGGIDWLICNAGRGLYKPFAEYELAEWQKVMDTNLSFPVFLIQRLMSSFREGGSVLLMSSHAGELAYSSSLVYGVSKAGLSFAAKALVKELEPLGVRVNAIAPGFIETAWQEGRSAESYERINAKVALHRFGEPDEVARLAVETLENPYINGSVLDIHGGYGYL